MAAVAACQGWLAELNGTITVAGRDRAAPDAAMAARLRTLEQEPDFARPLAIQMEALLWLRGASPGTGERGIAPMLDRMVDLEREHWKKVTEGVNAATLDRGVAQVTAVQGVEGRERAIALVKEDSAYFGPRTTETAAAVVRELAKLYGENIQEGPSSGIDVVVGLLAQQPARRYAQAHAHRERTRRRRAFLPHRRALLLGRVQSRFRHGPPRPRLRPSTA